MSTGPTRARAATEEKTGRRRDRSRPPAPEPLPHPVVDNHCHLDIADGPVAASDVAGQGAAGGAWLDVTAALAASTAAGVARIVQIGCDLAGARWAVDVAERYEQIVAGVALHPNEAPRLAAQGELDMALREIESLAQSSPRVRAVGETGLDFYRTAEDGRASQEESFRVHIRLAQRLGKTLVIHDRDAHDDILRVLDDEGTPPRTVMHCFSGDADFARQCLDRGCWLSFAGTVTFAKAEHLREAVWVTPPDRLLVETDAPYLTPAPYRGRPNASYLVPHTVRAIAAVLGRDLEAVCREIESATDEAYGGAWCRDDSA